MGRDDEVLWDALKIEIMLGSQEDYWALVWEGKELQTAVGVPTSSWNHAPMCSIKLHPGMFFGLWLPVRLDSGVKTAGLT